MSFLIKDNEVCKKYDKIWEVIEDKLGINFYSEPVYEYEYLKAKVRELDGMIKQTFWVIICQKKICIILALLT